ncbi:MAG: TldD/PmbA family protein [Planctomycetota bacterium]|jgi:PmbA protein
MPDSPARDELLTQARTAVELAGKVGADDAVAGVAWERSVEFQWRDGKLEKVQEDASRGLGIALYVDGRYSSHSTNDLEPARLEPFLRDAVALTRFLEVDPHRQIPDPALYQGRADVDLELEDPAIHALERRERVDWCRRLEEATRADESVISATTGVADGEVLSARVSSNGFEGTHGATFLWYGSTVTIREGDTKRPEDHYWVGGVRYEGMPAPDAVGAEALRRVLARRGAERVPSARTTMVVHPEAGPRLLGPVLGALSAGAVQQKRSFLAGARGEKIASDVLTLGDDPLRPHGMASRLYDGEGIAARRLPVIEDGVLRNFYVDTYYGRKLGFDPTTGSPSNVVLRHGDGALDALLREAGEGILVTSWLGGNADATTGDYSYGLRGHRIRGGEIAEPVSEMNVTGNYRDLLQRLVHVGSDPVPWATCRTPTLVFEDVQFSGN